MILSTPNILNIGSRLRYLFEGSWDFFREPMLEQQEHFIGTIENLHIVPWRYHELEYMLYRKGFEVSGVHTDYLHNKFVALFFLLYPVIYMSNRSKEGKSRKKGGIDFKRINDIISSKDMLLGKHLIVMATNTKEQRQSYGYYDGKRIKKFHADDV